MLDEDRKPDADVSPPAGNFATAFCDVIDKVKAEKGLSLRALVDKLKRKEIKTSVSSLSRIRDGQHVPSEDVVRAICAVAETPKGEIEDLVQLLGQVEGPPTNGLRESTKTAGTTVLHAATELSSILVRVRAVRRPYAVTGGIILLGAILGLVFLLGRHSTSSTSGSSSAGSADSGVSTVNSPAPAVAECNVYKVAARDLWLRDDRGGLLSEMKHGQHVTVETRDNPASLPYWLVTADDGRKGWTDGRYLDPMCKR